MGPRWFVASLLLASVLGSLAAAPGGPNQAAATGSESNENRAVESGCVRCHQGIEPMHPEAGLSCVDCHGGDAGARRKLEAHVAPPSGADTDERVAPVDRNLAWRRFRNPMDLRVVDVTCGGCHAQELEHLERSLHGTTAGHLSDGYYEVGLLDEKRSAYSVFPVAADGSEGGELERLVQVPPFRRNLPADQLASHYTDLARKECMQCHLYSQGRAVRGRIGFDGDYRGEGCAACHVPYALDGLSESADRHAVRHEPGHPWRHEMTRAPSTQTCTSCHYGDASIGLHFRGLSQLPPGAPGGPEIPGTTDSLLNRVFYLDDPAICPPDVHHERGMHCIDCHTLSDVMGDGAMHGKMEHAVEISCSACHGTFSRPSTLRTERGTVLAHLRHESGRVILTSKVTGQEHVVPQVVDVLDAAHPDYNAEAARAMTPAHESIECYTCHAGWNVNFLGFHFDRNASLTQLDLLSGSRTPGRVTTQEKVFATWKSFYAGLNERGAVAPYMTGFATMGSVTDEEGERILDQELPVTQQELSGMTMIHHQTHSVRPTARSCVECHRAPGTWGMGTVNFQLARQLAFVADRRGVEMVALNRGQLTTSPPLTKVVIPDVVDLAVLADPLQGFAQYLFVAEGGRGIHVIDVRDPLHPKRVAFRATVSPRGMELAGDHLYVADGIGGLRIFDVSRPDEIEPVASAASFDAHAVHVQWPYAYLADGPGGLAIYDVRAPIAPRLISAIGLHPGPAAVDTAIELSVLFQYSRPLAGEDGEVWDERVPARSLCAVLDERYGLALVDVTEPARPTVLSPREARRTRSRDEVLYRGLVLSSHVDVAEPQGGARTAERDYAYVLMERIRRDGSSRSAVQVLDVSEPRRPRRVGNVEAGYSTEMLALAAFYSAPFLQKVVFSPGQLGVYATDVSLSNEPKTLGSLPALPGAYAIEVETFPLDRMRDAAGRPLKDVSHPGSRWLHLAEIERVLAVPGERLGLFRAGSAAPPVLGNTARLLLAAQDQDGNGFLEGDEVQGALGQAADDDENGRVSLLEIADYGGAFGRGRATEVEPETPAVGRVTRGGPDGDLARLLDGIEPQEFDRDEDDALDRTEAERAFFAALDLDGSGSLSPDELSRYPGELRQIRYGDEGALELFRAEDRSRDGKVSQREFHLRDAEFEACDLDKDGQIALPVDPEKYDRRRAAAPRAPEWPYRRRTGLPLPPIAPRESVMAALDEDGDGELSSRELRRRKDLVRLLDADRNGTLDPRELEAADQLVGRAGVEATADGFEARWDVDGSGEVEPDEIPLPAWLRVRLLGR